MATHWSSKPKDLPTTTTSFSRGYLTGDQLRIIERYTVINDGNTLVMDFTLTDPEHWEGEWKHTKFRDRILKADVKEATCLSEDNLALPGM